MRRYKQIYRVVEFVVMAVTLGLLALVFIPLWLYDDKDSFELNYGWFGNKPNIESYSWTTDYYKMKQQAINPDLLFVTDIKGLTQNNFNQINGKAVILENLFSQESRNDYTNRRLEYLTGAKYLGFWGKTFKNLNDFEAVPENLIDLYEKSTKKQWEFSGEGIVLSDGSQVFVLKKNVDYKGNLKIRLGDDEINYYGYFEITSGSEPAKANYFLQLKDSGKKTFEGLNLPSEFPAIYEISRNIYEGYYFAGNFSAVEIKEPFYYEKMPWLLEHKGIYDKLTNEEVFWKGFFPLVSGLIEKMEDKKQAHRPLVAYKEVEKSKFYADSQYIYITNGEEKEKFFIKGVNIGAALPGKAFTEFPEDKTTYYQWLEHISKLNVNTVRVYTLLPPSFYQALYEFNKNNRETIYLLQEIWPEEKPINEDYLAKTYNETYKKEMEYNVKAIHGDVFIPKRSYRSSGMYAYDVSPYLIGYLVGRELEPSEVIATDEINKGYLYKGEYVYSEEAASPTESWLAASCDYALFLEDRIYNNKPLASIVSWPTLDKTQHDSEWNAAGDKSLQFNDKAVVDINNIGVNKNKVNGFFGSYHIYPNYPDFMNNEEIYKNYVDEQGSFRYGGYLREFMNNHKKYPALVAEYGLSTSDATAHYNPDGYNHGGLNEKEQALGIVRMTNAIIKEEYAGAVVFEWMDEWTKKTWTTEYYMIPYDRNMLWHNVLDPEQNYGVFANESKEATLVTLYDGSRDKFELSKVLAGQNDSYFKLKLDFEDEKFLEKPVTIAIDTYTPDGEKTPAWELLVKTGPEPLILVNPGYNWLKGRYSAIASPWNKYEQLIQMTNKENISKDGYVSPQISTNLSDIKHEVEVGDKSITISLPYGLMGISDPSSKKVLYDPDVYLPSVANQIGVEQIDEITLKIMYGDKKEAVLKYSMLSWDEPEYSQREKDGFETLARYFKNIK